MSGDREARILGASEVADVNGEEYKLSPLTAGLLCEMEREALRHYKREYIQTVTDNVDLLCNGTPRETYLHEKVMEVARWSVDDLPQKTVYDMSRVSVGTWKDEETFMVSDKVSVWMKSRYPGVPNNEMAIRSLLASALDSQMLSPDEIKEMTGKGPEAGRVRYDQWWITGCYEGMISLVTESIKINHPDITKEKVKSWPFGKIVQLARTAESLSVADMGNM